MAYTGRAPSAAPLTSGDITDGAVAPVDLSTGAPSWDTSGNLTVDGTVTADGASLDGAVVINEAGADVDFRVESDTDANALFVEGSSGNVGIGTSSPQKPLQIFSSVGVDAGVSFTNAISGSTATDGLLVTLNSDGTNATIWNYENGYMRFATNSTERMRIDSSGNLLVGTTTFSNAVAGFLVQNDGKVYITRDGSDALDINRLNSDGDIALFRKDGTTVGSIESFAGTYIILRSGGDVLYIDDNVQAYSDNTWDMGGPSNRWDDVYATKGTIQTSDRNEKQDIEELSEAEQRVAVAAKALMRKFRWKDAVAEKGDDARIHFGIIAQDLQAAFEAEGLDAGRYAMFISSTWWETQTEVPAVEAVEAQDAVYDDEGNLVSEAVEAVEAKEAYTRTDTYHTAEEAPEGATERTRLGVRYPELLAFIIAAI